MERKGIVFKLKKNSTIVMTGEFEFTEIVRRPEHVVGEEACFSRTDVVPPKRLRFLAAAASFIVLALLVTALWRPLFTVPAVYAYVGVDVNPSVEFAVDDQGRVLEARGMDDTACSLLSRISAENNPVTDVLQDYYDVCVAEGYLNGGHFIIGLTKAGDEELDPAFVSQMTEWARIRAEDAAFEADLFVIECDPALRRQAASAGLSAAELAIVEEARRAGIHMDRQAVRDQGLARAAERSGCDFREVARGIAVASHMHAHKRGWTDGDPEEMTAPGQKRKPDVPPGRQGQQESDLREGEPKRPNDDGPGVWTPPGQKRKPDEPPGRQGSRPDGSQFSPGKGKQPAGPPGLKNKDPGRSSRPECRSEINGSR